MASLILLTLTGGQDWQLSYCWTIIDLPIISYHIIFPIWYCICFQISSLFVMIIWAFKYQLYITYDEGNIFDCIMFVIKISLSKWFDIVFQNNINVRNINLNSIYQKSVQSEVDIVLAGAKHFLKLSKYNKWVIVFLNQQFWNMKLLSNTGQHCTSRC